MILILILFCFINADLRRASPVVPEPTTGGLLLNSIRRPIHHVGGTSIASLSSIEDDPRIVGGKFIFCTRLSLEKLTFFSIK